jgi:hypothetical protein
VLIPIVIDRLGSSTPITGKRARVVGSARVSPIRPRDARHRDQLSGPGLGRRHAIQRLGHVQLRRLRALDLSVRTAPGELLALPDRPLADPAEREPPHERRRVEVRDERLKRMPPRRTRRRDPLEQQLEERTQGRARARPARGPRCRRARSRRRSETRSATRRVEVEEELVHLVDDASIRASGRSTLLTTRITGSRASSALRRTKRVCGSGPRSRRRAGARRRPSSGRARPRRRSRRGRVCRRC